MADAPRLRRIDPPRRPVPPPLDGVPNEAAWQQPLFALFEAQAKRTPERIALIVDERAVTYSELLADAVALAVRLHAVMADAPRPVLVPERQGPVQVMALLACLRLGVACIPLDIGHSELHNRHIAALASPAVAVCTRAGRDLCTRIAPEAPTVVIDDGGPVPGVALPVLPDGAAAAMVLFTSGSSGVPKGVVVSQDEVARACRNKALFHRLGPDDRIATMTSPTTVGMFCNVLAPMLWGAMSVVWAEGSAIGVVAETFARHRISHYAGYVGFLRQLAAHDRIGDAFSHLRLLSLHGDRLAWAEVARLRPVLPDDTLLSYDFGLTECSWVAGWLLSADQDGTDGGVALGHAQPELEVWLQEPVEEADDGTLTGVFGFTVACGHVGYWRDPHQEDLRLLPHPSDPDKRVLLPGDVISCPPDGLLRFVGRADNQVKVAGWRVEPEEIETVARRAPEVAEAAIVARRDDDGVVRALVLHVAPVTDRTVDVARLTEHLRQSLPRHMWPAEIVVQPALPLTGTAKVDRARLAELDDQHRDRARPEAAPGKGWPDELSRRIVRAMASELERGDLAPDASFGDQGGDSLSALGAALRIEKLFGVTIDPEALLDDETLAVSVAAIVAAIAAAQV